MSILETVNKVREAEHEADLAVEQARKEGEADVARARSRKEELIDAARRAAEEQIGRLHGEFEKQKHDRLRELETRTTAELKEIRDQASRNRESALKGALDLFLSYCRKKGA